ncbi:MAG: DUF4397 domain-containing protein, partial [Deltaproteobacteria bacterium]|nr:DUF4397 domain-containing protein [Deltaproteobacteria bacterium]
GLGRSTSRRLEWYRTARIFRSLGAYEAAWLARGAGDEAAALADFEHAISEPRNDEREPMATHLIAAIALEEMCAPWRPEAAADAVTTDTQPEPSHAHVRLLHATPASSAASVSLFVGDAAEPIARDITFEAPASYAAAPALASELVVRGGEGTSPLAALSARPLRPHAAYTVILFGSGTARDPLVAELQEDVPVDSDQSRNTFRFFNAMAGSPALELCRVAGPRRTPLFSGATVGGYGVPHFRANATPVDPMSNAVEIVSNGVVELEVYPAGRTPCSGRKLGTARFSASSGLNGTIIAVGTYRTTRSRELFMCADAPSDTNCIEVPLDGR